MRFRPQRGGLFESMQEVKEFSTLRDFGDHLTKEFRDLIKEGSSFSVTQYFYDARIGWPTWIVTIDGQAVGFTDGPIEALLDCSREIKFVFGDPEEDAG
jgi:hypothetical protein